MADVTGPISTLPGASHAVPAGTMCDEHPDRPAIARVQGETDSMGCEINDMCQECVDDYREQMRNADHSGTCEWCKEHVQRLRDRRDYDEGLHGRVYRVCSPCSERQEAAALEYLRATDAEFDFGDGDD